MERKEAIELHREMWTWLAENPDKCKNEWPEWQENGGSAPYAISSCFACEECSYVCIACMLDWGIAVYDGCYCEKNERSPYHNWLREKDSTIKSHLANVISKLPIRDI